MLTTGLDDISTFFNNHHSVLVEATTHLALIGSDRSQYTNRTSNNIRLSHKSQ
ncbi:hypothetical protein FD48_GL000711 [Lactiplantibacillus paraplantarum DSM 10667]|nr:hypothetical protein FD48_GL000711 [Lactiplantibacillus paraplantarum DSM 10667]